MGPQAWSVEQPPGAGDWSWGSGGVSHSFPLRRVARRNREGFCGKEDGALFPHPGVVALEECERALRNLVDTRNLSGE